MLGSKIDNLKKLKESGIPVPDFFVVKNSDIKNNKIIYKDALNTNLYAVRSSCNLEDGDKDSFAGQFDTYLNVSKKDLDSKIRDCFNSINNKSIEEYAKKSNIDIKDISMNVIVQKMVKSDISGVLFTSNPTGILNESVVVAAYGLGCNVVEDKSDTTTYYYNNTDMVYYYEGNDILPLAKIEELISMSNKIKDILGDYLDIEFAYEKDKLYILQARKITTINDDNILVLDNSNIVESYPNISLPLTISFVNTVYTNVFKGLVIRVLKNEKEVSKLDCVLNNMVGSVNGRLYYKISNWYTLLKYLPFSNKIIPIWQEMLGVKTKITTNNVSISKLSKLKVCINYLKELFNSQKNMIKLNEEFIKINNFYNETFNENLSNEEIIKLYKEVEDKLLNKWDITLVNDMYAFIYTGLLKNNLKRKYKDNYNNITNEYISGISNIESLKPIKELINLAYNEKNYSKKEFNKLIDDYIELYGDRSVEELKLESKTFRTNRELLLNRIKEYQSDKDKLEYLYKNINNNKTIDIKESFITKFICKRVNSGIRNREVSRLNRSRIYGMVRSMILAIGTNLVKDNIIDDKRDIFYLNLDEIFNIDNKINYKDIIESRKNKYLSYEKIPAYSKLVFMDKEFDKNIKSININNNKNNDNKLYGTPCSFGVVEGEVLLITDVTNVSSAKDKIIITKSTDPGWVFLLANAKGIISEKGSLLSHTAIISRELKIPSIVGVDNLLKTINDKDIIRMDANKGEITIIKRSK